MKAIDGGRFSRYAQSDIQPGMALEVMVPQVTLVTSHQAGRQADYLAIAAGSGITPMMAIIDATLASETDNRFTLIYGNRSSHSMMFRQALADLKDRYPQRLQVVHLFSQESMDNDLLQGAHQWRQAARTGRPSAGLQPLTMLLFAARRR